MVWDIILSIVCFTFAAMTVFFNRKMLSSVSLIMFFLTVALIVFRVGNPFLGFVFLALSISSIAMFSIFVFLIINQSYRTVAVKHSMTIKISGSCLVTLLLASLVMIFYKGNGLVSLSQSKALELQSFLSALLVENMVPFLFAFLFLFVVLFTMIAIIKNLRGSGQGSLS